MESDMPHPPPDANDPVVPFEKLQEKIQAREAEVAKTYLAGLAHISIEKLQEFALSSQKFGLVLDFIQANSHLISSSPNTLTPVFTSAYAKASPAQAELLAVVELLHRIAHNAPDERYDQYASQLMMHILQEPPDTVA